MVKTNGTLFAVPVAGPTGQLYVRPVCGTERYTHNAQRLNCHKYDRTGIAIQIRSVVLFVRSVQLVDADDGSRRRGDSRRVMCPSHDVALECSQRRRDGGRLGAGSRVGGSSSEDRDHGVQPSSERHHRNGIEVRAVSPLSPSDGTCRIWDVNSTKEITSLKVNEIQLQEMKWDFTGSLLCTGMKNREYQIWDAHTSSVVTKWEVGLAS